MRRLPRMLPCYTPCYLTCCHGVWLLFRRRDEWTKRWCMLTNATEAGTARQENSLLIRPILPSSPILVNASPAPRAWALRLFFDFFKTAPDARAKWTPSVLNTAHCFSSGRPVAPRARCCSTQTTPRAHAGVCVARTCVPHSHSPPSAFCVSWTRSPLALIEAAAAAL